MAEGESLSPAGMRSAASRWNAIARSMSLIDPAAALVFEHRAHQLLNAAREVEQEAGRGMGQLATSTLNGRECRNLHRHTRYCVADLYRRAGRVRALASELRDGDAAAERLMDFAAELEALAAQLEFQQVE